MKTLNSNPMQIANLQSILSIPNCTQLPVPTATTTLISQHYSLQDPFKTKTVEAVSGLVTGEELI